MIVKSFCWFFLKIDFFGIVILFFFWPKSHSKNRMQLLFFPYSVEKIDFLTILSSKKRHLLSSAIKYCLSELNFQNFQKNDYQFIRLNQKINIKKSKKESTYFSERYWRSSWGLLIFLGRFFENDRILTPELCQYLFEKYVDSFFDFLMFFCSFKRINW